MESDSQNELHETINNIQQTANTYEDPQARDLQTEIQNEKADLEDQKKKIEDSIIGEGLQYVSPNSHQPVFPNIPQNVSVVTSSVVQNNSTAFHQAFNFSPAFMSFYYSSLGVTPGFNPGYHCSSPLTSGCLLPSGFPQFPSAPGFLTGAGYQFGNVGSPALGGLRVPGSSLLPLGHAGTLLHSAAILGDKLKLLEVLQDASINLEARDRWGRVALVYAVMGNHQEAVEALLRAGARPDATDSHNRTPLHFAAYKGHLGCIKAILHAVESGGIAHSENLGGVWLAQDVRGVTPLHHAAIHSNHKCLQALLKYAAPGTLDTEDHKKRTPLLWASAYGSEENVRLLIKHGANNLMPDQEGKTPLHWAAISKADGAKHCVRTLICAAPSSVNWQDFDGVTALHLAVAEARIDTVDVILSVQKCKVDLTDNQFRTALHWACNRGLTSIVGRLLERGAHLGAVDVYGATPLHYAGQLDHADTVELLVRRPCVRDDPTNEGHTALLWAAASGADSALTVMVRHGASLTQADPRGCTALHIAAGAGHVSTVGVLLRLRAPPDVCAKDGRTPLLHAAQAGHAQIVKILAKAGVSLDHRDNEGQCALHHAVLSGHLFLAQILIRAGTSVNVQDYSGRTPLHMAAFRGLSDIMFLLLENRGDVNARDYQGQSPLHWAAQQGHLGAVNTLLDFHAYPNYTQTTNDRYTPLDCAYVAEQLEVAQVLMEAGGLSVTRIMDFAATRIQAVVRGYLTRKHFLLLRKSCTKISDSGLGIASGFFLSLVRERKQQTIVQSVQSKEAHYDLLENSSVLSIETKDTHRNFEKEEVSLAKDDLEINSPMYHHPRGTLSEFSPYNSVSGQRRSKALASSIMRGARKKTLRNLELPGLNELGLNQMRPEEIPTDGKFSDSEEDNNAVLAYPVQGPSSTLAQALQLSSSIATAVVTAGIAKSKHELNISEDRHKVRVQSTPDDRILCMENSECEKTKCTTEIKEAHMLKEISKTSVRDSNSEGLMQDFYKWAENESGNKHLPSKCNKDENHSPCTKKSELTKIEDNRQLDLVDNSTFTLNESWDDLENIMFQKLDRKQMLEARAARSLNIATRQGVDKRNSAAQHIDRRVLSAEARKLAEEKWNNKLASLTLQTVQRPQSSKSRLPFSYNLVSPVGPLAAFTTKMNTHMVNKDGYNAPHAL
ncbi:inversin isoform X1 [Procambarus clarkii]|uniref:inversin isoform X1 n=2 Tax=Procambarus clarkii TaxID=6728 RepID=UPI003742702C